MMYGRYRYIYIYINGIISIDITCVGLASAHPNYKVQTVGEPKYIPNKNSLSKK